MTSGPAVLARKQLQTQYAYKHIERRHCLGVMALAGAGTEWAWWELTVDDRYKTPCLTLWNQTGTALLALMSQPYPTQDLWTCWLQVSDEQSEAYYGTEAEVKEAVVVRLLQLCLVLSET